MLPRPRHARRQSLSSLGEPPDRIAAEFRRRVRGDLATQDWYSRFDEDSLRWFRERGVRMSDLLLGGLDTTRAVGREQLILQAEVLGREYGVEAKRRELSLGEATQESLAAQSRRFPFVALHLAEPQTAGCFKLTWAAVFAPNLRRLPKTSIPALGLSQAVRTAQPRRSGTDRFLPEVGRTALPSKLYESNRLGLGGQSNCLNGAFSRASSRIGR